MIFDLNEIKWGVMAVNDIRRFIEFKQPQIILDGKSMTTFKTTHTNQKTNFNMKCKIVLLSAAGWQRERERTFLSHARTFAFVIKNSLTINFNNASLAVDKRKKEILPFKMDPAEPNKERDSKISQSH
jgi:hypothetical protein